MTSTYYLFRCASISWFEVFSQWVSQSLMFFGFPVNQVIPVIPVSQVIPVIPVSQVIPASSDSSESSESSKSSESSGSSKSSASLGPFWSYFHWLSIYQDTILTKQTGGFQLFSHAAEPKVQSCCSAHNLILTFYLFSTRSLMRRKNPRLGQLCKPGYLLLHLHISTSVICSHTYTQLRRLAQ